MARGRAPARTRRQAQPNSGDVRERARRRAAEHRRRERREKKRAERERSRAAAMAAWDGREADAVAMDWEGVQYFDYGLLVMVMLLFAFGLIMLYSTSAYMATLKYDDSLFFLKRQMFAAFLGAVAIVAINIIGYRFMEPFAWSFYWLALALNVIVIFKGTALNNSSRWLYIGGISVQPSEIAKVSVIILMAFLISRYANILNDNTNVIRLFAVVMPAVVLVAYSNLSTAVIIMGIAFVMLFIAAPDVRVFIVLGFLGVLGILLFISMAGYRSERISVWLHPEEYERGYQTLQGLYAIGSGGLFGKGLGESMQKLGPVPEAQNDMIFSIICEELGIFGAICVILMYILLLWRFMIIAINAKDAFGSYLVIGIMVHIALQVLLNIAVVTNSIPNTGITLPFISYGGTALSILMAEMGIAMSVSRGISMK